MTAYLSAVAQTYLVSRRSTPERIDAARRAALRNRLISDGASPETAEGGLERGSAYWQAGWDWIAEHRRTKWLAD